MEQVLEKPSLISVKVMSGFFLSTSGTSLGMPLEGKFIVPICDGRLPNFSWWF